MQIKLSYRPIKRLLLLPQVPARLKWKLFEIIEFMESSHCGFTCLNLFLIRKVQIFQVGLERQPAATGSLLQVYLISSDVRLLLPI